MKLSLFAPKKTITPPNEPDTIVHLKKTLIVLDNKILLLLEFASDKFLTTLKLNPNPVKVLISETEEESTLKTPKPDAPR